MKVSLVRIKKMYLVVIMVMEIKIFLMKIIYENYDLVRIKNYWVTKVCGDFIFI